MLGNIDGFLVDMVLFPNCFNVIFTLWCHSQIGLLGTYGFKLYHWSAVCTVVWPCVPKPPHWQSDCPRVDTSQLISFHAILWTHMGNLIGPQGFCAQLPFQCILTLIGAMSQNKFEYNEVTEILVPRGMLSWTIVIWNSLKIYQNLPIRDSRRAEEH